jgi:hypothetical protein
MMERLEVFLRGLCAMERIGGRTRIVDGHTLELLDVLSWPHGATEYVQDRGGFPDVVTHVRHTRHSLTGFAVVFTWRRRHRVELGWYVAIALLLGSSVYALSTMPWWGVYRLLYPV